MFFFRVLRLIRNVGAALTLARMGKAFLDERNAKKKKTFFRR